MTEDSDQLRGVAFHEAGHAVVAEICGLKIHSIEIRTDGKDSEVKTECAAKLSFIDQLTVLAAGTEAQKMFNAPTHESATNDDRAQMIKRLKGFSEEESDRMLDAGYERICTGP